jgi:PEP-CTERM motif-containing protein
LGSPANLSLSFDAGVRAGTGLYIDGPTTVQMTDGWLGVACERPLIAHPGDGVAGAAASAAPGELVIGPDSSGLFDLHRGTVASLSMSMDGAMTMDIKHGLLEIRDSDYTATVTDWINEGRIGSFGRYNDPSLFYITYSDSHTRVRAIDPDPHPADYNRDGYVTDADYTVWADTYGSTTVLWADGNNDGVVSDADYTIWADATLAPGVPEPMTMLVLGLGSLGLLRRRR